MYKGELRYFDIERGKEDKKPNFWGCRALLIAVTVRCTALMQTVTWPGPQLISPQGVALNFGLTALSAPSTYKMSTMEQVLRQTKALKICGLAQTADLALDSSLTSSTRILNITRRGAEIIWI